MRRRAVLVCCLVAMAAGACSNAVDDTPNPGADAQVIPDAEPIPDGPTLAPLRVDFLDPDHGAFAGGTEVVMRGRGFTADMTVTLGGRSVAGADLQVLDSNRAILHTPPGEPGDADLHIEAGPNAITREKVFLYEPIYVDPPSGGNAGGTYVRIRGLGTSFNASDVVTFAGQPMTGMVVVNGQEITGYTPAGVPGAVDVRIAADGGGELFAEDAYTYEAVVGTTFGGMDGGPIDGALNLRLIDAYTEAGIPMAVAVIGDPATSTLWGLTDPFGQLTISGAGLRGPITLTAGHRRYESGAMVGFDARNLTMFLTPLPPDPEEIPPPSGPFPPGRAPGTVSGDVVFGGATGIGTSEWDLVPEPPPTDGARKRTYVFTTAPNIFSSQVDPGSGGIVDFIPGQSSWQYTIPVRPTAFALVAIAGIWEPDVDPDGSGPLPRGRFTPYAMGVLRNILVGPGENLENVSITVDIPLDTGLKVLLPDAPPVAPAEPDGRRGPDEYRVNAILDLGGEGVIRLPGSRSVWSTGRSTILTALAPLAREISDASYTIAAGAYTAGSSSPYSIRILRGVRDLSKPVTVDGFVGVPRPIDPAPDGTTSARHLLVRLDGGGVAPTLRDYRLINLDNGYPVWRVLARGDLDEVPLYDLTRFGLPAMTTDELYFSAYAVKIPGGSFDTFHYGLLNANYWGAYAFDTFSVSFARP